MFNGRVVYVGSQTLAAQYRGLAEEMAFSLANRLEHAGLESGKAVFEIPEGTIQVVQLPHMREITIDVTGGKKRQYAGPIDYYSGIVEGGMLNLGKLADLLRDPGDTEGAKYVAKLYSYFPTPETSAKFNAEFKSAWSSQQPKKLAAEVSDYLQYGHPDVAYVEDKFAMNPPLRSQYKMLKPSMYYGAMRSLVQFVLGTGKQTVDTWYRKNIPIEVDANTPLRANLADIKTWFPSENDAYNVSTKDAVQLEYDFRFHNSHGLHKESSPVGGGHLGFKWWVVRIDQAIGAIAMELPLDPISATKGFLDAVEQAKEDKKPVDEDLYVLRRFGGFPTGRGFAKQVEAYIRAGEYVRLAKIDDLNPYPKLRMLSSQHGWAFDYLGEKAVAVAFEDVYEGNALCRKWSDMRLKILVRSEPPIEPAENAIKLAAAIGWKIPKEKPWLAKKIPRLKDSDALALLKTAAVDVDKALEELEWVVAQPVGKGSVGLEVREKFAFFPNGFKVPQFEYDQHISELFPDGKHKGYDDEFPYPSVDSFTTIYRWFDRSGDAANISDGGREMTLEWYSGNKEPLQLATIQPYYRVKGEASPPTFPDPFKGGDHYKAEGLCQTALQRWSGDDETPESYSRSDWVLKKHVDEEIISVPYTIVDAMLFYGENEGAAELRYYCQTASPGGQITYSLSSMPNTFIYDWAYGPEGPYVNWGLTKCYLGSGRSPSWIYCTKPWDKEVCVVEEEYRHIDKLRLAPHVWAGEGNWSSPDERAALMSGRPPEIPETEEYLSSPSYAYVELTVFANGLEKDFDITNGSVQTSGDEIDEDYQFLADRNSLITLFGPHAYAEAQVWYCTSNCLGKSSSVAMLGLNDIRVGRLGTLLDKDASPEACFVGVVGDVGTL